MHVDEPCTTYFKYLCLIDLLIYMYKRVYALSFVMHVFGMGLVVLGVSGIQPAREGVLGILWRG
jgi:hypothetical protein